MRLASSPGSFLGSVLIGVTSLVVGAYVTSSAGIIAAIALLGIAGALHLLTRIMGNNSLMIVICCVAGILLAVRMGWTASPPLPGK